MVVCQAGRQGDVMSRTLERQGRDAEAASWLRMAVALSGELASD